MAAYRRENRETIREQTRQYRLAHPPPPKPQPTQDELMARQDARRKRKRINDRNYRLRHRGTFLEGQRRWARTWFGFACRTWYRINDRTINGEHPDFDNPKNLVYLKAGVEVRMSREEYVAWCESQKDVIEGMIARNEKPSIDRINGGHYELGNMQIVPLKDNCRKAGIDSTKGKRHGKPSSEADSIEDKAR